MTAYGHPESNRYYVEPYDFYHVLVLDSENDHHIAVCHADLASSAKNADIEADALHRAESIAAALNAVGYDWKPPS
jgi:heat shock protein HspQ